MLVRLATHAMGTRFELVLTGRSESHLRSVGEECIREIELWHGRLSAFSPESDIARLNRSEGRAVRVDLDLFELLETCEALRRSSAGLFDISYGRRMEEAGFHPVSEDVGGRAKDCGEPEDPHAPPLLLDRQRLQVRVGPGVRLDLGGVAKGFALDQAAGILRNFGVTDALVHGGTSSVLAVGSPPGLEGWRVAIGSEGEPLTVTLTDACLAVTTPRGRVADGPGGRFGHVIDPRHGGPVAIDGETGRATAGVVGASALACDAWAKPVLLLGERPAGLPAAYTSLIHRGGRWSVDGPLGLQNRVQQGGSGTNVRPLDLGPLDIDRAEGAGGFSAWHVPSATEIA